MDDKNLSLEKKVDEYLGVGAIVGFFGGYLAYNVVNYFSGGDVNSKESYDFGGCCGVFGSVLGTFVSCLYCKFKGVDKD
ncbi:hypothetical protein K9L97_04030 [Candidatus Woesearchaeota archaeon]|nr:hypothetical protein [Candidatus Woesearchaeota archaeon]